MFGTHKDTGGAVPETGAVGPVKDVPLPGMDGDPEIGAVGPMMDDMLVREYPVETAQIANR